MGRESLKRIAALTAMGTMSVMVAGVVNVPALPGLPVTTTVPTTTVPSTTVVVPPTPATPPTTVTTPTVTTPEAAPPPVPSRKLPKDPTPKAAPSKLTTPTIVTSPQGPSSGGSGGAGSTSGVPGTADSRTAAGGGPDGPGGGSAGGPGGGTRTGTPSVLPATLSPEQAGQLRFALEQLEGCLPAIAPIDRQVLSMRAGGAGVAPLSRPQVASQLGVSARQVRFSERRGLSGLRAAAEQTGCAGPVGGPFAMSGIGAVPLMAFASGPAGVTAAHDGAAGAGGSVYVRARQAEPGSESPLARLTNGGQSGPAWLVVLGTVLFSVSIAGLLRELRSSVGA